MYWNDWKYPPNFELCYVWLYFVVFLNINRVKYVCRVNLNLKKNPVCLLMLIRFFDFLKFCGLRQIYIQWTKPKKSKELFSLTLCLLNLLITQYEKLLHLSDDLIGGLLMFCQKKNKRADLLRNFFDARNRSLSVPIIH